MLLVYLFTACLVVTGITGINGGILVFMAFVNAVGVSILSVSI